MPALVPERLLTERLLLRQFEPDDLDAWADTVADRDVTRYLGDGTPLSRNQAWNTMANALGHWTLRGYGLYAVAERSSGRLVGRVGLKNPEGWPGLEVGWVVGPAFQGHGYASEAGRATARLAYWCLGAERLISLIHPANSRSIRVAERLGARRDGVARDSSGEVAVYVHDRAAILGGS
jgi:RimJ/RimL family protein N-acetyltransferase